MAGEWRETTLGQVTDFLSGGTPSKDAPQYWGGTIPWVSAKDMKRFRLDETEDHVTEEGAANGTKIVPSDTILLLARGMTLLNDVPICVVKRPMTFNQDVKALRPKPGVRNEYLPYLLLGNKERLLSLVDLAGHGTGRLNSDELKSLDVILPPEPEQRAIAHILGTLDDKIELNRRMNETLEAMARALFKSWFVDFDPVRAKAEGHNPDSDLPKPLADLFPDSFEDSDLGKIPKGWSVQTIGDLADIVGGSTPSTTKSMFWEGGVHHWATPKDLSNLSMPVLLDTERRITDAGLAQIGSGLLPIGTVLLSSRAPIGYLAIAEIPVAINQGFIAMKPRDGISNLFLLQWTRSAHAEIVSRANGSTFLEISKANFRQVPVVIPPNEVMMRFDQVVRPIYERVVDGERESIVLSALRDKLLPVLIYGRVRVNVAECFVNSSA
jgi:type I restriction enzyme S subunit